MHELIGQKFKVLDDGFVRIADLMGDDSSIVQAARISYGEGTKKVSDDIGLIRYLMRHKHTTPFEMNRIKLHIRIPMDVWRQWGRHRTFHYMSVNEYSTRYSEAIDSTQKTPSDQWRLQSSANKQGSDSFIDKEVGLVLSMEEEQLHEHARKVYKHRLDLGVAREQARKDLPLSTYTELYLNIDLHNLLHFLELRMDSHAQWEIRQYANVIGNEIVAKWCPAAWKAFLDYRLNAITFSAPEIEILKYLGDWRDAKKLATFMGWVSYNEKGEMKVNREGKELAEKLTKLGVRIPWEIKDDV